MTDRAVRARVAGRQRVEARTAWSLSIGGFRVRCIRGDAPLGCKDAWEVQWRYEAQWHTGAYASDAHEALVAVVATDSTRKAIQFAVQGMERPIVGPGPSL